MQFNVCGYVAGSVDMLMIANNVERINNGKEWAILVIVAHKMYAAPIDSIETGVETRGNYSVE